MTTQVASATTEKPFPFGLDDLDCFYVEREDGTVVKFTMSRWKAAGKNTSPAYSSHQGGQITTVYNNPPVYQHKASLSEWCHHYPAKEPVYATPGGEVKLFIADNPGATRDKKEFDLVIDGGNVLSTWKYDNKPLLKGDATLSKALEKYTIQAQDDDPPKVLQIDWFDRRAPRLHPKFWIDLAARLKEDADIERVMTCCQGGHGRSGTALVALMMAYTDYSPLDAITHLRAVHCPRAIESKEQHEYLNWFGKVLGRPENALESFQVPDFKARFLAMDNVHAKPFQDRLNGAAGHGAAK